MSTDSKKDKRKDKSKKINFFSRYFSPLLFLSVVIIFILAYFLLLAPLISEYQKLSQSVINEKEEELERQKDVFNELSELNNIYKNVSSQLKERVEKVLPADPNLPNLYYSLDQIASDTGYKLHSIGILTPQEEYNKMSAEEIERIIEQGVLDDVNTDSLVQVVTRRKTVKTIKINLGLEGSGYLSLKKLLDAIENNLRIFDIQSFGYVPQDVEIELVLQTYYY